MNLDPPPIAAIATAPGRGGIGVVRISGKNISSIIEGVCATQGKPLQARHATLVDFVRADGSVIDRGLAIHFKAPHSYTGEDVLELQGHGGPVVLQMLLQRCLETGTEIGLQLAEPGEFTRRAFLNDKLDLVQAEAVVDLIEASTEAAARSASQSLSGTFSKTVQELVERIINLRMLVEATLDFPEEEIGFLKQSDALGQLAEIREALAAFFTQAAQGALLREGLNIVLAGQPNVGKSSLLNALAGNDVAIVTPIAGTTRDKVIETIQVEGIPINVIDTAGIRTLAEAVDEVEHIGIERTWEALQKADVIIHILDAAHGLTREDEQISARFPEGIPVICIWNKIDLSGHNPSVVRMPDATNIYLSAAELTGIDLLREELLHLIGWQQTSESLYLARERHLIALQSAHDHLELAAEHAADDSEATHPALDLFAEELRLAQDRLSSITGEFTSDDLLGVIFSRFCIGK